MLEIVLLVWFIATSLGIAVIAASCCRRADRRPGPEPTARRGDPVC